MIRLDRVLGGGVHIGSNIVFKTFFDIYLKVKLRFEDFSS